MKAAEIRNMIISDPPPPVPSTLEAAQADAESIAQASQAAQAHAERIAEEAQAALVHAERIAEAAQVAHAHAKSIAQASQTAQARAESIAEASQVAHAHARRISDALSVSEIRYRRLFETARDGILLLDSETGRITDANPFMEELLGCSHAEFQGKELWEIGLLSDKEARQEAFRVLQRVGYIRYDNLPLINRQGQRREVKFTSNLYREGGHSVIQCNVRDITVRKAVEHELATAAARNERIVETLQRSMLQETPAGKFPNVSVQPLYVATLDESAVGGDFFDVFAMGGDRVALVVGDVSGKGLAAAERTTEVKYALRAFLHAYQTPGLALSHLNDFICETHRLDKGNVEAFIVLALAIIEAPTGEVVFSSAGAEPTLILRVDGKAEPVEISGLPLGIHPGTEYTAKTHSLAPGETVLMATDGITEARRGAVFLGSEGLRALAEKVGPAAGLPELSQAIHNGAWDFAGGSLRDDVCLLLARLH